MHTVGHLERLARRPVRADRDHPHRQPEAGHAARGGPADRRHHHRRRLRELEGAELPPRPPGRRWTASRSARSGPKHLALGQARAVRLHRGGDPGERRHRTPPGRPPWPTPPTASRSRCRRGWRWRHRWPRPGWAGGLSTIDSSIWVAVITGLPSTLALRIRCFCTTAMRSMGISTPRSPRATITPSAASRISSRWSSALERSILATTNGLCPARRPRYAAARGRWPSPTKDWLTMSTPCSKANRRHSRSRSVNAADAEVDAGQVEPFARAQLAADHHPTADVGARDLLDLELDQAVVQERARPRPHHQR